jgi:hypothetical protein
MLKLVQKTVSLRVPNEFCFVDLFISLSYFHFAF